MDKRLWIQIKKNKHCYLWLAPFFILFALFYVYPSIYGFLISLRNYDGIGKITDATFVGLQNYAKLFHDKKFWSSLRNTFALWAYIVPARTFLALVLAALLNSKKILGKKVYSMVVLIPYITAVTVVAIIFRIMMTTEGGIFNNLLNIIGIPNIEWLSSTSMSKISVAIMNIWRMVGYFSLVLLSGMQKIPTSVYEAAKIDGANSWKVFFKITLPLMIPEIFFVALMSTIWIFQNVGDVMVLTQGGPIGSSTTLVYYMYMNAFEYSKLGYASAITYVLFLLLMLISGVVVKSYYTKAEEV